STIVNEIYFTRAELEFAYEHSENYVVKVVKDNEIYDVLIKDIIDEYIELKNKFNQFLVENIKVKIKFIS
ncbi:hypothetical protein Q6A89_07405, partial [Aliarcobacter skirrowii]|uniref:hypothetical protein n=1 Tax=Aliarcobacter skirrowii TaxID=28200 RepID=UPI0029B30ED6